MSSTDDGGGETFRVMVSGLSRSKVHRHSGGIDEEDDLGWLFYNRGCKVADVRLMVDTKSDKSRGFGFLDFEDAASLDKALQLDPNTQDAQLLADRVKGPLRVEVARQTGAEALKQERKLAEAKDATEALERELHLRQARLKELSREVDNKRRRQAHAMGPRNVQADLEAEQNRQDEIRRKVDSLRQAEELLSGVLRLEQERTSALEEVLVNCCETQKREHHGEDEEHHDEVPPPPPPSPGDDPLGDLPDDMQDWRIRNTFIDFYAPNPDSLVRLKTAPALVTYTEETPSASPASPGDGFVSFDPPARDASPPDDVVPPAPAPWALKRSSSAAGAPPPPGALGRGSSAEVSRQLLEDKMGGPADPTASKPTVSPEHGDVKSLAPRAPLSRREVRLRNLPLLAESELKEVITSELKSLWRIARGQEPPVIDDLRVDSKDGNGSWAQKAAGTDAVLVFADAEDAAWLVEGRSHSSWSSVETLTVRGRVLHVEWVTPVATDWRRLRYKADTDASSHISYGSEGTHRSCSSAVASRAAAKMVARHAAMGQPADPPPTAVEARNRTVVLDGLPKSWPSHQVVSEVSNLLQLLWKRDGLSFDLRHSLHQGKGQGGIIVRKPQRGQDENNGSCLVRFRDHLDAKWLVEQKNIRIGERSTQLKAFWARPRQPQ